MFEAASKPTWHDIQIVLGEISPQRVILNESSRVDMKQLREMVRSGLRNRSIMDVNHAAFKFDFTIVYKDLR